MAKVFDGGVGDHPLLLPAIHAHSRQFRAEMEPRYEDLAQRGVLHFDLHVNIERERAEAMLVERTRLASAEVAED